MFEIKGEAASGRVWIDGEELLPGDSQKVWNHSPDGFSWGYTGSGPAQLALAVLLKFFGKEKAIRLHQNFKSYFISRLKGDFKVWLDLQDIENYSNGVPFTPISEREFPDNAEDDNW